ncbi:cellulose binding domain-containing protein, partial [Streptomyces sp. NPDC005917]
AGRPDAGDHDGGDPGEGTGRARVLRHGLLGAAVMISLVALGVSMMPMGSRSGDDTATASHDDRQPVADPTAVPPSHDPLPTRTASAAPSSSSPSSSVTAGRPRDKNPDPEPQGTSTVTAGTGHGATGSASPTASAAATCQVSYDLVNQWTDGFQATVTVTTTRALADWRLQWSFRDGQKVTQMWDANVSQSGGRVTVDAADYNRAVSPNGSLSFGFLGTWSGKNSSPYAFTLNGGSCSLS